MRICYVLLTTTHELHQYTADLANRMALVGHEVRLVSIPGLPRDRYAPAVTIHTPVDIASKGLSLKGLRQGDLRTLHREIAGRSKRDDHLASTGRPDVVHFTGRHLWNVPLVRALADDGIPVVHSLDQLDPSPAVRRRGLRRLWNRLIISSTRHILVHSRIYWERLLDMGVPPDRVSYTPLLHLFISPARLSALSSELATSIRYERWALFFGSLDRYKGIDNLLTACAMMNRADATYGPRLVLAGPGDVSAVWSGPLPPGVELRSRLIPEDEAIDLFRRCGLLFLPYIDDIQSALLAAAYYLRKPVVVTRAGALPEYVEDGQTGRVVEPDHPPSLARCLEEMLNDPVRLAQMGSAGRTWYDAYRAAEMRTLLEMYQQLADRQPITSTLSANGLGQQAE